MRRTGGHEQVLAAVTVEVSDDELGRRVGDLVAVVVHVERDRSLPGATLRLHRLRRALSLEVAVLGLLTGHVACERSALARRAAQVEVVAIVAKERVRDHVDALARDPAAVIARERRAAVGRAMNVEVLIDLAMRVHEVPGRPVADARGRAGRDRVAVVEERVALDPGVAVVRDQHAVPVRRRVVMDVVRRDHHARPFLGGGLAPARRQGRPVAADPAPIFVGRGVPVAIRAAGRAIDRDGAGLEAREIEVIDLDEARAPSRFPVTGGAVRHG